MMVLVVVGAVALLTLLLLMSRRAPHGGSATYPYERRELFSAAERSFLGVLDQPSQEIFESSARLGSST